jgi:hypothetical protein
VGAGAEGEPGRKVRAEQSEIKKISHGAAIASFGAEVAEVSQGRRGGQTDAVLRVLPDTAAKPTRSDTVLAFPMRTGSSLLQPPSVFDDSTGR